MGLKLIVTPFGLQYVNDGAILTFKSGVANAAALPMSGNTENDARITNDVHHLYTWNGTAWVDQGDIIDIEWSSIVNRPDSSVSDIDIAVNNTHVPGTDSYDASDITNDSAIPLASTVSDALNKLNTTGWVSSVKEILATPPGSFPVPPSVGDRYLIPADGTGTMGQGAWAGKDGYITYWDGANWQFIEPFFGWMIFVEFSQTIYNAIMLIPSYTLGWEARMDRVGCMGEMYMKTYYQASPPSLSAEQRMAIWVDTDDANRVYLIYQRNTGGHVKTELT